MTRFRNISGTKKGAWDKASYNLSNHQAGMKKKI